jgi:hypothetical protein
MQTKFMSESDNGTHLLFSSFNGQLNLRAKVFNRKHDVALAGTMTHAISKTREK